MIENISLEVRRRKLSYLGPERFDSLYECVNAVQQFNAPGDFTEFGVALGGSGICLARALDADRRYYGFDVFGMIPPPSAADGKDVIDRYNTIASGNSKGIGGDKYYGYVDNLYDMVKDNFRSFGCDVDNQRISLVKGLFSETLPLHDAINISIAHIDCDWYEPVLYCLKYAWPRLSEGGFIILDDYNDWSGCRKATDEFISSNETVTLLRARPHAVIQKRSSMQNRGTRALDKV